MGSDRVWGFRVKVYCMQPNYRARASCVVHGTGKATDGAETPTAKSTNGRMAGRASGAHVLGRTPAGQDVTPLRTNQ